MSARRLPPTIHSCCESALYILSQDRLAALSPSYWYFWLGLMLIGIVLLGRGGVVGWLERFWLMIGARRKAK